MKNNKIQIVVLGAAVLLIWSLVVYRFFDLQSSDVPQTQNPKFQPREANMDKEFKPFEYHMNYSEPFALNQKERLEENSSNTKTNKPVKKKSIPKRIVWPKISFIGTMSSTVEGEKDSYFVEIDDKTETLIQQDSIGDLKILGLNADSVWFEKESERKAFYIDQ